jgi:hypothetical protein
VSVARRHRSPQDKKGLSLARDRPLVAEYPKAFRKQFPRKRTYAEGARRSADRRGLAADPDGFTPVRRATVRKWGAPILGDVIAGKQRRRAKVATQPRKSPEARERRRLRRGRE